MSESEAEASFNDEDATAEEVAESLRKVGKVVNNLMARADCIPFREPVDWKGLQLYDYPKIIPRPMDLGTIKRKLEKGKYPHVAACVGDVRLVWRNCMTYNADGSDFYRLAESYSKRLEERYQKLLDEFGADVLRGAAAQPRERPRADGAAADGRTAPALDEGAAPPPPPAKSDRRRAAECDAAGGVPLDDRARFAARLQRLSGTELGHVLAALDAACPAALEDPAPELLRSDAVPALPPPRRAWDAFDGGCRLEVDVDAIPAEVFRRLDAYAKERVRERGRGPWSADLAEPEPGGTGKKRKIKSL